MTIVTAVAIVAIVAVPVFAGRLGVSTFYTAAAASATACHYCAASDYSTSRYSAARIAADIGTRTTGACEKVAEFGV